MNNGAAYTVHFRDTLTGETKAVSMDLPWHSGSEHLWREGDFSKAAARVFLMYGENPYDAGQYTVPPNKIVIDQTVSDATGKVLYRE